MTEKVGENFQREWDREPFQWELWDCLEALDRDRLTGIKMLTDLAEQGSSLAMMYLGHTYVTADHSNERALGEAWLIRSAECGSIEGRYQLAVHYREKGEGGQAVSELKSLARQTYAPAMYLLGAIYYRGELVDRDVPEAVHYLNMAKKAGHLPAMGLLSWIYRKEKFGLSGRVASHWNCLAKIPAVAWYIMRYPASDRLRGFNLPSRP